MVLSGMTILWAQKGPYNAEMIPYSAATRNRSTDPSQVNWWDGTKYRVDAGTGFMYYQAMSGYFSNVIGNGGPAALPPADKNGLLCQILRGQQPMVVDG